MKNKIFPLFLLKVTAKGNIAPEIANFCMTENIPAFGIEYKDGKTFVYIRPKFIGRIKYYARTNNIELEIEKKRLSKLCERLKKRYGLLFGAAFFIFILIHLSGYIWSVDISGNDSFTESEIRKLLYDVGVYEGAKIKRIDKNDAEIKMQVKTPQLSYVCINFVGTRCKVEVRESENHISEKDKDDFFSNLVAKKSGKIIKFEVTQGQTECQAGDYIEKGTLIVSGIVELKNGAYKTCRSKGKVFAETESSFECEIPFENKTKVYTGNETEKKEYFFLGKRIAKKGREKPEYEKYDTSVFEDDLILFGIKLPIRVKHRIFSEYVDSERTIDVDRAEDLAYDKYKDFIRENLGSDYEMLKENAEIVPIQNGIKAFFHFTAIEDISEEKEFYYTPLSS